MREFLRLAALLGLLGLAVIASGILLSSLGLTPVPVSDQGTAHRTAGGNALTLLISFGGAGLLYFMLMGRGENWRLFKGLGGDMTIYLGIAGFMAGLFLLLPWLGLDAESFELPASLKRWERILEAQEAQIETLMRALIQYASLAFLLLTMAVAPAIAEELFFRGALQTQLARLMNPHLAVWLAAFIFSAIHFQVYGLVPRFILGAVMGYLTLWTGRLAPAMWAHFLNNAYATILAYLGMHFLGHPEWIDSTYRPPLWIALLGAGIAGGTGFWLYRRLRRA
ncbi:MAG: CPBP family intramembrane metalloprotease [Bacteroidia bacterium]|nr:CPBP family intramembrane metalloprotease [Bacteroidia bacterium]